MDIEEVDHLLGAAVRLKDTALELDGSVDPVLRAACQHLAEAVFGWQEWDSLRMELEGEEVWGGAVFDLAANPEATGNYAEHVERVVAAANQISDVVFSRAVLTIPDSAMPAVDAVVETVGVHRQLGETAQARWLAGERPSLVTGAAPSPPEDTPPPPDVPRPSIRARLDDGGSLGLAPAALHHRPVRGPRP
ncbi:MAG TPA: hypothetical protein VFO60_11330 [Candidatus Dormibacteraeota bacterium]|nr:hypothetical protein [Candidatus Dormibacteraeota bacterium]